MNETPKEFMGRMTTYCMMRKMSKEGTLGYLTNLRTKLIDSEQRQIDKRNDTHEKIRELSTFIEKLR